MTRSIATICAILLLLAGAAGAVDPSTSLELAIAAHEAGIQAQLENETERALRQHKAVAEAALQVADCRGAADSPEARTQSATERHRRLVDCFGRQRANAELIAVNPE